MFELSLLMIYRSLIFLAGGTHPRQQKQEKQEKQLKQHPRQPTQRG